MDQVLEEAQRRPILIRRRGQDTAVVLSMAAYERLRSDSIRAFFDPRNDVAREASEAGLTEDIVSKC